MAGKNLIILPNGKRRCRACQVATTKRLRREATLRVKAGFAESIDNLTLAQLDQRRSQAQIMLETAEVALDRAKKETQRRNAQFQKAERKEQRAMEIYHAAVQLLEKIEQLREQKANEQGVF